MLLSKMLELRGGAEAAKLTMRSWQIGCMRCGNAGSTEAELPSQVRYVPLYLCTLTPTLTYLSTFPSTLF